MRYVVNRCTALEMVAGAHFGWAALLHACELNRVGGVAALRKKEEVRTLLGLEAVRFAEGAEKDAFEAAVRIHRILTHALVG